MKMLQTANKLYITQTRPVFYCNVKIKIPASFNENILEDGFSLLEDIDRLYNSYTIGSYFSNINQNAGSWVETDQVTVDMLKQLITVSELTGGTYDVTAMPLLQLWGFYKANAEIPMDFQIDSVLKNVDYRKIEIDGIRVKIGKNQQIITGSFIKAFAVDMLVKQLKANGVSDAVINAGGSTIYALNDAEHPYWNINIPHPYVQGKKYSKIALRNNCFSLSARANNYITINGKQYGHIVNAATGYPSENIQSGIMCSSAFLSDVISTALFTVDEDKYKETALELQDKFDFTSYLIGKSGYLHDTQFNVEKQ